MVHIIDGPNKEFASRLISLRRDRKVTQEETANAVGIDKRSISMYENGRTMPREGTIQSLAHFFDVDPYWLATGHTQELKEFLEQEKSKTKPIPPLKKLDFLYIESWDTANFDSHFSLKSYTENPSSGYHTNEIHLFTPVVKSVFDRYRAIRLSHTFKHDSFYTKGSIIIIDEDLRSESKIQSGSDVVFRLTGKENPLGIRKIAKEPGLRTLLIPLEETSRAKPIEISDINVEIMGTIISAHRF